MNIVTFSLNFNLDYKVSVFHQLKLLTCIPAHTPCPLLIPMTYFTLILCLTILNKYKSFGGARGVGLQLPLSVLP